MPFAINKTLISLSLFLVLVLLISKHASQAVNIAYPDRLTHSNQDPNSVDILHYVAKRRFLPTRRDLHHVNAEFSGEDDEDESHLNTKRYFLKSKRYFLNSKRDDERRDYE